MLETRSRLGALAPERVAAMRDARSGGDAAVQGASPGRFSPSEPASLVRNPLTLTEAEAYR